MEDMQARVSELLEWFPSNRYVQAALIFGLALVTAKVLDWMLGRALKQISRRTKTDIDDRLLAMLHRPLFQIVMLIGLGLAAVRLELPPTVRWLTLAILKTLAVLVVVGLAMRLSSLVLDLVSRRGEAHLLQARTLPLFDNVAKVVLVGGGVYFLFLAWNIDVAGWLAGAGIVGIAVGFAAKDSLANLFSGVFILTDAPYKLGDFIVLDSGERGRVTQIGLRSTRLLTRDDVEITIPNAVMGSAKVTNESSGPYTKQRVRAAVGVAYGSDVDQVRRVLMEVARAEPLVVDDPEPRVRFRRFGDSSLDFELLCWIEEPVLRGSALDALNTAIYKQFEANGIQIPFPQRDLWIRQSSGASGT